MTSPTAWSRPDRILAAAVVAMLVPIVVAVTRAVSRGWTPIGDNAYFLVRSRDVLTEHHPLLGTWTSASQGSGIDFNNPGPLLFDLLALPAKLGGGTGIAIGVAAINATSALGVVLIARRRAGTAVATAAALVITVLCSSLGSELLFDPWQPHSLLLPFLLGLALAWSVTAGETAALPWALGVGSLVVQTHLSYTLLVVGLGASSVLGLVMALRRQRTEDPDGWPSRRRSLGRALGASAVVVALAWAQPAIEAVTSDGQANIVRIFRGVGSSEATVGVPLGARVVADVVGVPPFWLRPSFSDFLAVDRLAPQGQEQIGGLTLPAPAAVALLLALGGAIGWMAHDARRRRDREVAALLVTAGVALAGAWATASGLPLGPFGIVPHHFRWLWPIAAFATLAILAFVIRRGAPDGRVAGAVVPVLALMTALVAMANLPTSNARSGPSHDDWAIEVMARARPQMAALEGEGPLLVESSGAFNDPYTGPVLAELQRRGVPFGFTDEGMIRQFGPERRLEGDVQHLLLRRGDQALSTPEGLRRVVFVAGLTEAEQRELRAVEADLTAYLDEHGLALTERGRALLERPGYEPLRASVASGDTARALAEAVPFLAQYDLLDLPAPWRAVADRYAELHQRWEDRTMALFLAPSDREGGS